MNFKQYLNEMPITRFDRIGDWSPTAKRKYGFNRQDAGIIGNDRAVDKIHRQWSNSKEEFDFYFVRDAKAYKHVEEGEVTPEWVQEKLGLNIQPREDAITVIFTNNTGAEKIPMTAWTIAHRFGHAIRRDETFYRYFSQEIERDFQELLKEIYGYKQGSRDFFTYNEKQLRAIALAVGTMKSVRNRNLRNFFEFAYELVAQYIITGKITFNPLPRQLIISNRMAWGRPNPQTRNAQMDNEDLEDWNGTLQGYAGKYEHYLDSVFMGLVGKIFVM